MSEWGFWGYLGIVAGLVVMLAMVLFFLVFGHRTLGPGEPEQSAVQGARSEGPTTDTKRAA